MVVFIITGEYRYRNKKTAINLSMAVFSTESYSDPIKVRLNYLYLIADVL